MKARKKWQSSLVGTQLLRTQSTALKQLAMEIFDQAARRQCSFQEALSAVLLSGIEFGRNV